MRCENVEQAIVAMSDICERGEDAVVKFEVPEESRLPDGGDIPSDYLYPYYEGFRNAGLRITQSFGTRTDIRAFVQLREFKNLREQFEAWLARAFGEGLFVEVARPREYVGH